MINIFLKHKEYKKKKWKNKKFVVYLHKKKSNNLNPKSVHLDPWSFSRIKKSEEERWQLSIRQM